VPATLRLRFGACTKTSVALQKKYALLAPPSPQHLGSRSALKRSSKSLPGGYRFPNPSPLVPRSSSRVWKANQVRILLANINAKG